MIQGVSEIVTAEKPSAVSFGSWGFWRLVQIGETIRWLRLKGRYEHDVCARMVSDTMRLHGVETSISDISDEDLFSLQAIAEPYRSQFWALFSTGEMQEVISVGQRAAKRSRR